MRGESGCMIDEFFNSFINTILWSFIGLLMALVVLIFIGSIITVVSEYVAKRRRKTTMMSFGKWRKNREPNLHITVDKNWDKRFK